MLRCVRVGFPIAVVFGLLFACGCSYTQKCPFDPNEYAPFEGPGNSAVEGQAFLLTKGGEWRRTLTKNQGFPAGAAHAAAKQDMLEMIARLRDIPRLDIALTRVTELPLRMKPEDIVIHRTRNTPKCATVVIMDMSGSMRYDGQYINVKRMALALDGLIRREYPGDYLNFVEMFTFARPCRGNQIVELLPKPVTIFEPIVRLKADMSSPDISEHNIPPHFTNVQHGLQLARQFLAAQDTPNRQIILITDGLPTAHFEGQWLYLLYPPDPRTEEATMREAHLCQRDGITINLFLVPSWSQSEEDIRFAYRVAESTRGRVFFTAGGDLDRFVVWDYINRKREILA